MSTAFHDLWAHFFEDGTAWDTPISRLLWETLEYRKHDEFGSFGTLADLERKLGLPTLETLSEPQVSLSFTKRGAPSARHLTPALSGRAGEIRACRALNEPDTRCPRPLKRMVRFQCQENKNTALHDLWARFFEDGAAWDELFSRSLWETLEYRQNDEFGSFGTLADLARKLGLQTWET